MEFDTPARIAILGAGPIGVEAALYARYLGYDVDLYERGEIGGNIIKWGHVRLFTPFSMNASPLGLAALQAQDPQYEPPAGDAFLTGSQWVERYVAPLANTDLVRRSLRLKTEVLNVGREGLLKSDKPGSPERAEAAFRLLVRDEAGERIETADLVIDATGAFGKYNANPLGDGGLPAIGENELRDAIWYGLPDLRNRDREQFLGKHTLVVGSGYSAATNVAELAELAKENGAARITWLVREPCETPMQRIANDQLPTRDQLAAKVNELAGSSVNLVDGSRVHAISRDETGEPFIVATVGKHESTLVVDRIIANTGYRPDNSIYSELQVHECYATGGPMKLAAALMTNASVDCLDQQSAGSAALVSPEPNFCILGAKSYGRNSNFLFSVGLQQIRDLFAGVAGRAELDLYATHRAAAGGEP